LPNRNLFYDRMRHATEKAKRCGEEIALLFLDIDRFKHVNDTLGHDIGDELLRQVARRLQSVVRRSDTLARMGGDEFTIIAEDIGNDLAPQKMARQIIDALSPAFLLGERSLCVSASIGIALFPKDAEDIDTLIRNADTAMYVAKEQGRATFRFFTAQLNQLAHQRLEMEQNLRQAIAQQHFELHYQPQVQASDGRLIAIEALLRWRQDGEPQSPEAFIPVLEEIGLITQITGWVLREACAAGARLAEQGAPDVRVAVNLSAMQFQQSDLPDLIDEALADSSIQPEQLEVEITESTLLEREHSRNNASQLVKRGVRIAIDDFGTGYSSLTYLKRFRVDALKIDRSFVQNILSDPEDAQITSAVIALAQGLVIDCVAEGVEDIAQFHLLRELGCELIQGYLVCRPIDSDALMVWAASQSWRDDACFWSESA
jgi:diguanylate cyclase (GGDEF)-like protein